MFRVRFSYKETGRLFIQDVVPIRIDFSEIIDMTFINTGTIAILEESQLRVVYVETMALLGIGQLEQSASVISLFEDLIVVFSKDRVY
jgi:hypothetical protein